MIILIGYIDIAVTDRYVYALLSGRSIEESGLSAFTGNIIYVFDWGGTLQRKIMCNTDLTTICVSPDDSMIYAVGLVEDYELLNAELKRKET
ncbi:BF3164 family lipoprotein [uncultured Bacteroides sp.]|uniref:BF3164 family lipoprotein n=1 Tax=uncultured Bacteroides sp. TaxID=162156 RepID=UPI00345DB71A